MIKIMNIPVFCKHVCFNLHYFKGLVAYQQLECWNVCNYYDDTKNKKYVNIIGAILNERLPDESLGNDGDV